MAFTTFAAALQGLEGVLMQQMNSDGLTYQDGFKLPFPQLLSIEEETVNSSTPGANQLADENTKVTAATITLRWARVNLEQLAKIRGSLYEMTGDSPSRQHKMQRRASDNAPFFKIEGRVDYVGSDLPGADWHLVAYRCKAVSSPTISHETGENYASIEMQFRCFYRSDGAFYDLVMNETSIPLSAAVDTTPPTISSTVPADDASSVAVDANIVITFSEAVRLDKSNYSLQRIVSSTSVVEVEFVATINNDKTVVTLNPTADLTAASNYNLRIANVLDLAGNALAAPSNRQFATA
jgi:hypothetical protein